MAAEPFVGPESVTFAYDHEEARGEVVVERGYFGPVIKVGGREVAWVDLFPAVEGRPPQILIPSAGCDENLAQVVFLEDGRSVVGINAGAARVPVPDGAGITDRDTFYGWPEEGPDGG